MGVFRITSLIHKQGWTPSNPVAEGEADSACRLWKDWNPSSAFLHQGLPVQQIPAQSSILIDGNSLAFFLFKVSYARYLKSLFHDHHDKGTFPSVKSVKPSDLTRALPCMMPLDLLEDVTQEYTSSLRLCNLKVQVFWDGPSRRFKTVTANKRTKERHQEWSNLQQYSTHGSLPNEKSIFGLLKHFPVPSLFLECVRKTLGREQTKMVYCTEEADVELAKKAYGNDNAFILGQDSDFYFYKDIQYVPFDAIFKKNNNIYGCVGRRGDLAKLLGIEDELMIELAILLGNDYIQSLKVPKKREGDQRDPIHIASYLREQDNGFLVSSNDHEIELAFVRALYNLKDLDSFPLHNASDIGQLEFDADDEDLTKHLKIQLPSELTEIVDSGIREGHTLSETVQKCLTFCAQQSGDSQSAFLGLNHLDAYEEYLASFSPHKSTMMASPFDHRPQWADFKASYFIEKCISLILKSPRASLLAQLTLPSTLFSHYDFHCTLASKKKRNEYGNDTPEAIPIGEKEAEPIFEERKILPIDTHEKKILENVAENRVTIIHGETGCGKSSRVPVMLLNAPSPEPSLPLVKFFISQPRRSVGFSAKFSF